MGVFFSDIEPTILVLTQTGSWGVFFPFGGPVGWTAAALAYTGIATPNGNGKEYWLPGTSVDPISRHLMPDVLKGMSKLLSS